MQFIQNGDFKSKSNTLKASKIQRTCLQAIYFIMKSCSLITITYLLHRFLEGYLKVPV